jgi:alpha-L-arabinofuranosidase
MARRRATAVVAAMACGLGLTGVGRAAAPTATLDVDVNKPGVAIPPTFFGFMTEEINHSYDGGLLAELVQNRTFQDPLPRGRGKLLESPPPADPPTHWSVVQGFSAGIRGDTSGKAGGAKMATDRSDPVTPALPISLRLDLAGGAAGLANDGYWGVPVRPLTTYTASFYAKAGGGYAGPVTASLTADDGTAVWASTATGPITDHWQKYTVTLTTGPDSPVTAKAKFVVAASGTGSVSFSLVSLFPPTYMDTPGGLRPDLMKLMADLHPAFIRLPGGNYLEGDFFSSRFNWKHEIGPMEDRPGHMGCWNYRSSGGFGLPQYLLWCKQLHAEPVLAVFAGYVLQHQSVTADSAEMKQYIQEALEEIEYVSGPSDSEWGKRRAADGFPEPFKLTYVEIGNEDWFDPKRGGYDARYTAMADAIRARYPQLKLIATAPIHQNHNVDLYDDHYYRSAAQMATDSGHYDAGRAGRETFGGGHHDGAMDRTGPQIFVGEWATREGRVTSTLNAALADSAWLMGMERNADLIPIQCYAPLLVNVNPGAWQWRIDLIGYDALRSFGSASYYAQAMLAQNKGDVVLPATLAVAPTVAGAEPVPHGAVGVGTWHTTAEFKDITVTAPDGKVLLTADLTKDTPGAPSAWTFTGDKWSIVQGALKPSALDSETWGTIGDPNWTDYTLRLKARKTAGKEGFLILFHVTDGDNYVWWNVGGWGNTRTQLEAKHDWNSDPLGRSANFTVQPNRWYDLRLEVSGHHVRCYADDRLISEASDTPERVPTPLFASASYAKGAGDVIVSVVNMGSDNVDTTVNLRGAAAVKADGGKAIVLSGRPNDENTLDEPTKVAPKEEPLTGAAASFHRTFPPHSLTVLRVSASPQQ